MNVEIPNEVYAKLLVHLDCNRHRAPITVRQLEPQRRLGELVHQLNSLIVVKWRGKHRQSPDDYVQAETAVYNVLGERWFGTAGHFTVKEVLCWPTHLSKRQREELARKVRDGR